MSVNVVRGSELYVSQKCRAGLRYVAYARGEEGINADAIAEEWLMERLAKEHKNIVDHMNTQAEAEKEFRKTLRPDEATTTEG